MFFVLNISVPSLILTQAGGKYGNKKLDCENR
jgi:hypothetical protein